MSMGPRTTQSAGDFSHHLSVPSVAGTTGWGAAVADILKGGDIILLTGPLGAGKTCFVQGLCGALKVAEEVVSPTFTLVNTYEGRLRVHHLDFYRVAEGDDLADIGVPDILDEVWDGRAVLLVEWPLPLMEELGPESAPPGNDGGNRPRTRGSHLAHPGSTSPDRALARTAGSPGKGWLMLTLAFDTATLNGRFALAENGQLLEYRPLNVSGSYADALLVVVNEMLTAAGKDRRDLRRVAVTTGPGSFTGVRIGVGHREGAGLGTGLRAFRGDQPGSHGRGPAGRAFRGHVGGSRAGRPAW